MAAVSLFSKPRSFILVWPGEDECRPQWDGTVVQLPPRTEVALAIDENGRRVRGSRYRFNGAKGKDGKLIPGTVVLQDEFNQDMENGSTVCTFNAFDFVRGLDARNQLLFQRGLHVVETVEEVPAAMAEGVPMWRKCRVAQWEADVRREAERRANYGNKGQAAPPLTEEGEAALKRAILGLREESQRLRSEVSDEDLLGAIGGPRGPTLVKPSPTLEEIVLAAPVTPPKPPEPVESTESEDLAVAAANMYRAAKGGGIKLTHAEIDGLLTQDRTAMSAVEAKLEAAGVEV